MIKITILPDKKVITINKEEVLLKELIKILGEQDLESIAIIVNDKLIDNENHTITSEDKVLVIRQATGGM